MHSQEQFLHQELQNQRDLVASLSDQVHHLQARTRTLADEKAALLRELIEQKSCFEDELLDLRRQIASIPVSPTSPPLKAVHMEPSVHEAVQAQQLVAASFQQQNKNLEKLVETMNSEILTLKAKLDTFEFLKKDYARLSEEFQTKSRVADSLARKLATYTAPPPVDIELLNFQHKVAQRLAGFTEAVARLFGWQIRELTVGGYCLTRGEIEVCVADNFQLISVKGSGENVFPNTIEIPELLALLALGNVCNRI
jgi:hypothetical protein